MIYVCPLIRLLTCPVYAVCHVFCSVWNVAFSSWTERGRDFPGQVFLTCSSFFLVLADSGGIGEHIQKSKHRTENRPEILTLSCSFGRPSLNDAQPAMKFRGGDVLTGEVIDLDEYRWSWVAGTDSRSGAQCFLDCRGFQRSVQRLSSESKAS